MKLKHILPITTIAGVAAIAAPIATSCSCSSNVIKLEENVSFQGDGNALINKDPIKMVEGKKYHIRVDIKAWTAEWDNDYAWGFFVVDNKEEFESAFEMDDMHVKCDGTEFEKVDTIDELAGQHKKFVYYTKKEPYFLRGCEGDLTHDSIIDITFKAVENSEETYFLFGCMNG